MTEQKAKSHVAAFVSKLEPRVLQHAIDQHGLEASGELVVAATPAQLARVFDVDLWRAPSPGEDERFDAERFGVWLEVLVAGGEQVAAEKLAAMDEALLIVGLSAHVRVYDNAAVSPYVTSDGDEVVAVHAVGDADSTEIGGYRVVAERSDAWTAIVTALAALDAHAPECFGRVMVGCRELSHRGFELDGLNDLMSADEQALFDVASDREERRAEQGYVAPAEARAFLDMSRAGAPGIVPSREVVAAPHAQGALVSASGSRYQLIERLLDEESRRDPAAYAARTAELALLTNALVAGCSFQGRAFTPQEAAEAAIATCNLGLESWLETAPGDALSLTDLVRAFRQGWKMLYDEVVAVVGSRLVASVGELQVSDTDIQSGLDDLRRALIHHAQSGSVWRARGSLDVLAELDVPVWMSLVGLLDEYPVIPAAVRAIKDRSKKSVDATSFEFIASRRQIALIHEFLIELPELLTS